MKTSIKLWSIRKLTALGRITVLKTIIIPKLTYLFISLPNPSKKLLKSINDTLFKFIWQNKPDKIKRDLITQEYQEGGIKLINITNFIAALKATWIRRVLMNKSKGHNLFQVSTGITVNDIVIYGDSFIKKKKQQITNTFWKDVPLSYAKVQQKLKPQNVDEILGTNIWHNSNIVTGSKAFLYKNNVEKGIIFINDLCDELGNLRTFENFIKMYNIKTNVLECGSLIRAVKCYIGQLDNIKIPNNQVFPFKLKVLLKSSKYIYINIA